MEQQETASIRFYTAGCMEFENYSECYENLTLAQAVDRDLQAVVRSVWEMVVSCWHWELCWIRKSIFRCYASDFFWRRSGPGSCL